MENRDTKKVKEFLVDIVKNHRNGLIGTCAYNSRLGDGSINTIRVFAFTDIIPRTVNEIFKVHVCAYNLTKDEEFTDIDKQIFASFCNESKKNSFSIYHYFDTPNGDRKRVIFSFPLTYMISTERFIENLKNKPLNEQFLFNLASDLSV